MSKIGDNIWARRAEIVRSSKKGTSFIDLVKSSGLDITSDFRFTNLSGVNFSNCDLDGFDFTGARLYGCNFRGAKISGARFDQAEIGAVSHNGKAKPRDPARQTRFATLSDATDWAAAFDPKNWRKRKVALPTDHLPIGAVFQDAPFAPELVVVPSGGFSMGSQRHFRHDYGNEQYDDDFTDGHPTITFDRPFAIGRFVVKAYEFIAFEQLNLNKVEMPPSGRYDPLRLGDSAPISNVTWDEAVAYCEWLNEVIGLPSGTYRLPSEAEWEYAARAGTEGPFWWDGPISRDKANYDGKRTLRSRIRDSQILRLIQTGTTLHGVVPVDRFDPNPWGLYQVHGNVWEWCRDVYAETIADSPSNGTARESAYAGSFTSRVARGGAWHNAPQFLQVHRRIYDSQNGHERDRGFRIARTLTN